MLIVAIGEYFMLFIRHGAPLMSAANATCKRNHLRKTIITVHSTIAYTHFSQLSPVCYTLCVERFGSAQISIWYTLNTNFGGTASDNVLCLDSVAMPTVHGY